MSHYKPSTPNPDPMYSYYYTSLPRSVPLKNGYEADLEIHQATLNDGKGMLQQEIEKEVPDSSELHRLGEILGETMKSYGKAASSIKKQVAVPLSLYRSGLEDFWKYGFRVRLWV